MTQSSDPVVEALTDMLANVFRLMFKTQTTHWNAQGPYFLSLHATTERQYTALFGGIDTLAERIRALGHPAPTSLDELMARSDIRERYDIPSTHDMIVELAQDHRRLAGRAQELAALADTHHDSATADLAAQQRGSHEKEAWVLDTMLADPTMAGPRTTPA